ncbi:hypothetical protein EYF80_023994 [Liparis tanakae]|uniref:Uncharacterized protein n=1 Tax=Liparis tanakae TaxID=230148 RepID=A0A4Z2HM24_9TELE|nr:hypothetical protein EYF80_023994 [Liparis tanakae]
MGRGVKGKWEKVEEMQPAARDEQEQQEEDGSLSCRLTGHAPAAHRRCCRPPRRNSNAHGAA